MELKQYLEKYVSSNATQIRNVILINDESLSLDKKTAYRDANSEKKARGALLTAVERHLSREDIVICDGLNYIKGFRYQLYVVARTLGTPTATVIISNQLYCGFGQEQSIERNASLQIYNQDELENLISRFEEPNAMVRWDAPLFIVIQQDKKLSDNDNKICSDIVDAVILKKAPAPNLSTVVKPLFETNYVHELDRTVTDILDTLIEAQKNGRYGAIVVPKSNIDVCLPSRSVTLSELRRLKRQFLNINKTHTQLSMETIAQTFADYLNTNFQ